MTTKMSMSQYEVLSGRCAVIGDEPLAAQCVEIARASGLDVVVVASTNPQVINHADDLGIVTMSSDQDLAAALRTVEFDILLSIANLRILPDDLLAQAAVAINFHDGPVPDYIGLNVTSWAIFNAENEHGITWHMMTSDVDAGGIVTTDSFPIHDDDTAFSLNARCYEAALASFPRVAAALATGTIEASPQPDRPAHLYRRRDRPHRVIEASTNSAHELHRLVRALDLGHLSSNEIGVPLLFIGDVPYVATAATMHDVAHGDAPGTVEAADQHRVRIATTQGDLAVDLADLAGQSVDAAGVLDAEGLGVGDVLSEPPTSVVEALRAYDSTCAAHENFWADRLATSTPSSLPQLDDRSSSRADLADEARDDDWDRVDVRVAGADPDIVAAAVALWLARVNGTGRATFSFADDDIRGTVERLDGLVELPLACIDVSDECTTADLVAQVGEEFSRLRRIGPYLRDLVARQPALRAHRQRVFVSLHIADRAPDNDRDESVLRVVSSGDSLYLLHRSNSVSTAEATRFAEQIATVVRSLEDGHSVAAIDVLTESDRDKLDEINNTEVEHDRSLTIDGEIWARAALSPDEPAVSFGAASLTFSQLIERTDALAIRLAAAGTSPGSRVGIAVPRGLDMLIGVLATLRLGAAYVPLDPAYPADRLEYMVDDAGIATLLATGDVSRQLERPGIAIVDPTMTSTADGAQPLPHAAHSADDLAYVIYTSGSTGKPKGVMLEHRNVINFFVAMDAVIDHDPPGVWLAVTSLSFDISVLELLWTLNRGCHVVLKAESGFGSVADQPKSSTTPTRTRPVSMSLFYFAAAESSEGDGYRLLLEGARFADRNGFEAVWTPERHFHAFGGAYPNPSVISAAIAATTEHVDIRAGSVVLPLHSPVRVAEEWAIVDNLSGGRVGISFAPGWQPNDFVLNPATYGRAREELPGLIEVVQQLWRGDSVEMPGHDGEPVTVSTLPRPIQSELPIWLTSAGSPSTFEQAGRLGTNVLTHLLGQTHETLAANIARYRAAWAEAGHEGEGHMTLMLHTFLAEDAATAKSRAQEPMKAYLGTAVGLIKNMASSFPTFAGSGKDADEAFASLTPDELNQLLEMAAARYLDTAGLFGTPEEAAVTIASVGELGVDEVACLVDFGVDVDEVLESLPLLQETKRLIDLDPIANGEEHAISDGVDAADTRSGADWIDESVASLIERHGVTHLQCTPSLAAMLVANPIDRRALESVRHLMVGGEALPVALGRELRDLLPGRFTNMYGPTETTIWSLVHELDAIDGASVPIGRPIANTIVYVLDAAGHRLPLGTFGELHIGGEGVARGYHNRTGLTEDRFVERPGMGVLYATGDVVRIHPDGHVEFGGRSDNQLKIRGHRIELGEIESVLDAHPAVAQSVVVPRGEEADPFLVAFVVTAGDRAVDESALRAHVGEELPAVMVPSTIVSLAAMPLTPNGKIDRNALPEEIHRDALETTVEAPVDDDEKQVADIWSQALGRPVGRDDNFFEIGGHSLLAVRVFRTLCDATNAPLALTDLFRFPTVRTLAEHLASLRGSANDAVAADATAGSARGERRRRAMARRAGGT